MGCLLEMLHEINQGKSRFLFQGCLRIWNVPRCILIFLKGIQDAVFLIYFSVCVCVCVREREREREEEREREGERREVHINNHLMEDFFSERGIFKELAQRLSKNLNNNTLG